MRLPSKVSRNLVWSVFMQHLDFVSFFFLLSSSYVLRNGFCYFHLERNFAMSFAGRNALRTSPGLFWVNRVSLATIDRGTRPRDRLFLRITLKRGRAGPAPSFAPLPARLCPNVILLRSLDVFPRLLFNLSPSCPLWMRMNGGKKVLLGSLKVAAAGQYFIATSDLERFFSKIFFVASTN